jgi:hypothetical protein
MRLIPEADVTSGTELFSAFQTFAGANERPSKVNECRSGWERKAPRIFSAAERPHQRPRKASASFSSFIREPSVRGRIDKDAKVVNQIRLGRADVARSRNPEVFITGSRGWAGVVLIDLLAVGPRPQSEGSPCFTPSGGTGAVEKQQCRICSGNSARCSCVLPVQFRRSAGTFARARSSQG